MNFFKGKWNFFFVGVIFALSFILSLYILDAPIGMSDGYLAMSEYCGNIARDREFSSFPIIDWQTGFLLGILIGAIIAVYIDKSWKLLFFPEDRRNKKLIPSVIMMLIQGFVGGFLVMLGLQLSGDSFLGHWSSAIQLSTSSLIFIFLIFIFSIGITMIIAGYQINNKDSK